jgi:holo-[acyl-carrier protein] synthase
MIIGIGTDLCDIRRIERTLERFKSRFITRIYTESEQARANRRVAPANAYAMNFAAKEACAKALGTGFRQGVFWRYLSLGNLPSGKPHMVLTGGAKVRLDFLTTAGMEAQINISLTDEYPMAHAMVIISAEMAT